MLCILNNFGKSYYSSQTKNNSTEFLRFNVSNPQRLMKFHKLKILLFSSSLKNFFIFCPLLLCILLLLFACIILLDSVTESTKNTLFFYNFHTHFQNNIQKSFYCFAHDVCLYFCGSSNKNNISSTQADQSGEASSVDVFAVVIIAKNI